MQGCTRRGVPFFKVCPTSRQFADATPVSLQRSSHHWSDSLGVQTPELRSSLHELGHNFTLDHSGVWDNGSFYKWEDWPQWDGVYGPIMGGGGEGQRNGWSFGAHSEDMTTNQDTMEIIRQRVIEVGGSSSGWREDDFVNPAPLCQGQGELYREAILGEPDDEDRFGIGSSNSVVVELHDRWELVERPTEGSLFEAISKVAQHWTRKHTLGGRHEPDENLKDWGRYELWDRELP